MNKQTIFQHVILVTILVLAGAGCSPAQTATPELPPPTTAPVVPAENTPVVKIPTPIVPTQATTSATKPASTPTASDPGPTDLWEDATSNTIGKTEEWTNKVELADINGDGLVDILFANGGDYETPGEPIASFVFINQGPGEMFREASEEVLGPDGMLARVIKVRDVNGDGNTDILVGTTFQNQSQLYFGDGAGNYTNVTDTNLPAIEASVGDLEFGDVDGDGDLDVVLADWGPESPMRNEGGRTRLWVNDGQGRFSDETGTQMPDVLVKFSWELEFVDVDNDFDLDVAVSCKRCSGSFLFENDGKGIFTDKSNFRIPQFTNNYEFEAMDVDGDNYLDLVTINDGTSFREHIFTNDGEGGFEDETETLWPDTENRGFDDNMVVFLDFDSDGDADFLIGSLDGPDRLLINDGSGHLIANNLVFKGDMTNGTLAVAVSDLNGDHKLDVVQAQGEAASADKVFLGTNIQPDSAPPSISLVEAVSAAEQGQALHVRARVHDNKSPTMPQDWSSVDLVWAVNGQTQAIPMTWYGEYLWSGVINQPPAGDLSYQVCATDAAGNEACSEQLEVTVK